MPVICTITDCEPYISVVPATPEVVISTSPWAASDDKDVKSTTEAHQCTTHIKVFNCTHRWLGTRPRHVHCWRTLDTTALHQAINIHVWSVSYMKSVWISFIFIWITWVGWPQHKQLNIVNATFLSSPAAPQVVISTTPCTASDENDVKSTIVVPQCTTYILVFKCTCRWLIPLLTHWRYRSPAPSHRHARVSVHTRVQPHIDGPAQDRSISITNVPGTLQSYTKPLAHAHTCVHTWMYPHMHTHVMAECKTAATPLLKH